MRRADKDKVRDWEQTFGPQAEAEGWLLSFAANTEKYEIQRFDEARAFASDADALRWVAWRAARGSACARGALDIVRSQ